MKKTRLKIYDINRNFLRQIEFDSLNLALQEAVSGHYHCCEIAEDKKINYTCNNRELKLGG